ncbi:sulfurtransferase TusA family protein [Streptomyces sp. NPDC058486]|uniref:sulfurtransferase TusA family protein n=1 Tax=unclassified Streptomyces TaxID=2593676 RepID=UPI003665FD31
MAHYPVSAPLNEIPAPSAYITVDGTGLLRVTLLLRLRARIADAGAGTVVHVVATDPAAPLDLPAWCHMTGHSYLGPVPDDAGRPVYALRLAADARSTRPDPPGTRPRRAAEDVSLLLGGVRVAQRPQAAGQVRHGGFNPVGRQRGRARRRAAQPRRRQGRP